MDSIVWSTWHDKKFDCDKYLYHYTTVEKACKILFHNSLRFSPLSNTNDTMEAKVKINFNNGNITDFNKKKAKINEYMMRYSEYLQLLCFCKDETREKTIYTKENDMYFVDMMGRGFALPRMWAQYGGNNRGVCFIIDKELFEKKITMDIDVILMDSIIYKNFFSAFDMDASIVDSLYEGICSGGETITTGNNFFKQHTEYVRYSFFTKFLDWKNENEYRYLICSENKSLKEVHNLSGCLKGIVVGERIEEVDKWIIEQLAEKHNCDVKEICFDYNCCWLK